MATRTGSAFSCSSGPPGIRTDATIAVPTPARRYISARAMTERSDVTSDAASPRSPHPRRCRSGELTPNTSLYSDRPVSTLPGGKDVSLDICCGRAQILDRVSDPDHPAGDHIRPQAAAVHESAEHPRPG